jgi:hypothetical protein
MRRVLALVSTTGLLLGVVGCGARSYEIRLNTTLENMKYRKKLDDNLMPAPMKGKLEQLQIFLRPPKSLEGPAQEFQLIVLEPGKFDISDSFYDTKAKQNLHVLARVKLPKGADAKKKTAEPQPTNRGEFVPDVFAVLHSGYGLEVDQSKLKDESKKGNKYKHLTLDAGDRVIQLYLYGAKTSQYEVALIFVSPKSAPIDQTRITLCLESFAVAEKARRIFGGGSEAEPTEGGAPAPATTF